jgi:hypothetical protein
VTALRTIVGSELSCYTTAVATLHEALGLNHEHLIGAQLYTAVRLGGDQPAGFVHHHTSLRSEALGAPGLARRAAASWPEALACLREQVAGNGAVIVVGDVHHLPWQAARGRTHAPHWFVVDGFAGDACHVTDLFEYEGEHGVQGPHRGWLPLGGLAELARPPDYTSSGWFAARELHALGDLEDAGALDTAGHQWYEATPRRGVPLGMLDVLRATVRQHGGREVRADLDARGWTCGLRALEALSGLARERLHAPGFYDVATDLWVAARTRALFATACAGAGTALRDPRFARLGEWCREELGGLWAMVPRAMEYNRGALRRGRAPRPIVSRLLDEIVAVETELLARLERLLDG